MSGTWQWTSSGSSFSSPIYIGVDLNWYAGSSFARPLINMDNPLSLNTVASCAHPDDSIYGISLSGTSYVYFDSFEFVGSCSSGKDYGGNIYSGVKTIIENIYIHGWTMTTNSIDDTLTGIAGNGNQGNRYLFNVIDGADSTWGGVCTTPSCVATVPTQAATMWGMRDADDVEYSVIRHVSNGIQAGNITTLVGNLLEYIFEPTFGDRHGNVVETVGGTQGSICRFYNNVSRNSNSGVFWWPQCSNFYIFNNIWENSGHVYGNPAVEPNGLMLSPPGSSGSSLVTAYVYNNTFQNAQAQAGPPNSATPGWAAGSRIYFANNHLLDMALMSDFFNCSSGDSCSVHDDGGNIYQSLSAAQAQGYILANNYAPGAAAGATMNAGVNMSTSCSLFSSNNALCSSANNGVIEMNGRGGKIAVFPGRVVVARSASGAWNAGAY